MPKAIAFNTPNLRGRELHYISQAHLNGQLAGSGPYTQKCSEWLERYSGSGKVLLTHSCTAALEMSALLLELAPGDEVIMPSYTFVSTANAFVLRGATPVFVDIRPDTLNLNEKLISEAISPRTKAIVPVHYAGVACQMDVIMEIAKENNLWVIEDAAQGVMSSFKGRPLGSIGHLGAYSFHETKNVISGEGGCLLVNETKFLERAEILWEKGTDRSKFLKGQVDKYTWQDVGSSFLPGEVIAAFLWGQLEEAEIITRQRLEIWERYDSLLEEFEAAGDLRRPVIPEDCTHNAHMYYVLLEEGIDREALLSELREAGIHAVFHYQPLHSSPAGQRFGRVSGDLSVTDSVSERLIRLPLWIGLSADQQEWIVETLIKGIRRLSVEPS